jgi:hypothetical protein
MPSPTVLSDIPFSRNRSLAVKASTAMEPKRVVPDYAGFADGCIAMMST